MMRKTFVTFLTLALTSTGAWANDQVSTPETAPGVSASDQIQQDDQAGSTADENWNDPNTYDDTYNYDSSDQPGVIEEDDTIIYDNQAPGMAETTTGDLSAYDSALKNETIGLKPQVGVMVFDNVLSGESEVRGAAGATLDFNVTKMVSSNPTTLFLGLSTGALFSHLGSPNASFLGGGDQGGSSNLFLVPANVKVGWNMTDALRVGLHGGGNVIYRSEPNSIALGGATGSSSDWSIFPNVGADLELGIGRNTALIVRPDITFTSSNDLFTGTLGFSIAMG